MPKKSQTPSQSSQPITKPKQKKKNSEAPGPPVPRKKRSPQKPPKEAPKNPTREGISKPGDSPFADYIWSV